MDTTPFAPPKTEQYHWTQHNNKAYRDSVTFQILPVWVPVLNYFPPTQSGKILLDLSAGPHNQNRLQQKQTQLLKSVIYLLHKINWPSGSRLTDRKDALHLDEPSCYSVFALLDTQTKRQVDKTQKTSVWKKTQICSPNVSRYQETANGNNWEVRFIMDTWCTK